MVSVATNVSDQSHDHKTSKKTKDFKKRPKVGDPDFKPPDGGWGWLIVLTCGLGNLCSFPMFHQFGLVFKEKFAIVGIDSSQTLTILNLCVAFNTGVGLVNGPLFSVFTLRQVALCSSLGVVISLFILSFCTSFWSHVVMYSFCFGASFGLLEAANSLAINNYFEEKRRTATGYTWTIAALGPIVCPYIIVFLEDTYGINGVIICFSALAMHSFACALFLQPVEWHTKVRDTVPKAINGKDTENVKDSKIDRSFFENEAYCNSKPASPTSQKKISQEVPLPPNNHYEGFNSESLNDKLSDENNQTQNNGSNRSKDCNYTATSPTSQKKISLEVSKVTSEDLSTSALHTINEENKQKHDNEIGENTSKIVAQQVENNKYFSENTNKLQTSGQLVDEMKYYMDDSRKTVGNNYTEKPLSLWNKVYMYFDLDLIKDLTYVNLNLGLTFANVTEMNFSLGTPIILSEFNFTTYEIANFMSILAATDIIFRFISSLLADRIGWSNRTYFLLGVLSMALGRVILVHTQSFRIGIAVAVIIGIGKALRAIFMVLVIPSHVSLERLPAAYGLQFATSGIIFMIFGPVVGFIREYFGTYVITLHILNIFTYLTALSWTVDSCVRRKKKKFDTKL